MDTPSPVFLSLSLEREVYKYVPDVYLQPFNDLGFDHSLSLRG